MCVETLAGTDRGRIGANNSKSPLAAFNPQIRGHVDKRQMNGPSAADVDALLLAFRRHPHISNILSWLSDSDWLQVEEDLRLALSPTTRCEDLSPLERAIIELACTNRHSMKRVLTPYVENCSREAAAVEDLLSVFDRLFQDDAFKGRSTPFVI